MLQQAKHMWETMTDEAREDYGEHYFEYTVRRTLEPYTKGKVSTPARGRFLLFSCHRAGDAGDTY